MKVIVLLQLGDSLRDAQGLQERIRDYCMDVPIELAVETGAEDPETKLGSYEEVKKN